MTGYHTWTRPRAEFEVEAQALREERLNRIAEEKAREFRLDRDRLILAGLVSLRATADVHHDSEVQAIAAVGSIASIPQGTRTSGEYVGYILDVCADIRSSLSPLVRQE